MAGQVLRRPGADQGEQQHRPPPGPHTHGVEVGGGQRADHRHGQGLGVVPLAYLGRGQVEPAEGAELVVGQRGDRALDTGAVAPTRHVVRRLDGDGGQGQAFGVDQLERAGLRRGGGDRGRDLERHQAFGPLEAVEPQRPVREQLEIVELSGGGTVLGEGNRFGHGSMVPHDGARPAPCPDPWTVRVPTMPAPVVVAEIVRSGFVEGHHYGSVVILASDGSVQWSVGDVVDQILPRSCNKPLQAVGMLRAGLDLDGELLALAAASHSGEPFHLGGSGGSWPRPGSTRPPWRPHPTTRSTTTPGRR